MRAEFLKYIDFHPQKVNFTPIKIKAFAVFHIKERKVAEAKIKVSHHMLLAHLIPLFPLFFHFG